MDTSRTLTSLPPVNQSGSAQQMLDEQENPEEQARLISKLKAIVYTLGCLLLGAMFHIAADVLTKSVHLPPELVTSGNTPAVPSSSGSASNVPKQPEPPAGSVSVDWLSISIVCLKALGDGFIVVALVAVWSDYIAKKENTKLVVENLRNELRAQSWSTNVITVLEPTVKDVFNLSRRFSSDGLRDLYFNLREMEFWDKVNHCSELRVLQTWSPNLDQIISRCAGKRVKILLLHPQSDMARIRGEELDKGPDHVGVEINRNLRAIHYDAYEKGIEKKDFQVKLYCGMPGVCLHILDDEVAVAAFFLRHVGAHDTPNIQWSSPGSGFSIGGETPTYGHLIRHWNAVWADAHEVDWDKVIKREPQPVPPAHKSI